MENEGRKTRKEKDILNKARITNHDIYNIKNYDYEFPKRLIAKYPLEKREECRLLVLDRSQGKIEHRKFSDIIEYLTTNDLLILNKTRVIKARLFGKKDRTKLEFLLLKKIGQSCWLALSKPSRKLRIGDSITFKKGLDAEVTAKGNRGKVTLKFNIADETLMQKIEKIGVIPIPPYLKRKAEESDQQDYQTVFAINPGSVAAPTAGLHFSEKLLQDLKNKGINYSFLTLHTGYGTFSPIDTDDIRDFKIDDEWYEMERETIEQIKRCKKNRGRIFAVGTTSVRALEFALDNDYRIKQSAGWNNLYISPGYNFKVVDCILTNFHLPKSSLIVLVSAFAGIELIKKAYTEAIIRNYRLFSYGDAMLIM